MRVLTFVGIGLIALAAGQANAQWSQEYGNDAVGNNSPFSVPETRIEPLPSNALPISYSPAPLVSNSPQTLNNAQSYNNAQTSNDTQPNNTLSNNTLSNVDTSGWRTASANNVNAGYEAPQPTLKASNTTFASQASYTNNNVTQGSFTQPTYTQTNYSQASYTQPTYTQPLSTGATSTEAATTYVNYGGSYTAPVSNSGYTNGTPATTISTVPQTSYYGPTTGASYIQPVSGSSCCNTPSTTVYSPIVEQPACAGPVIDPRYRFGKGILGQPKVYVNGQPVRNALRYLTP